VSGIGVAHALLERILRGLGRLVTDHPALALDRELLSEAIAYPSLARRPPGV
jgi:hypothetical protein